MSHQRVVVVGGGVVGTACAWYLAAAGIEVTLVDRVPFNEGCSYGNCGLICPSHVLPLAEPGAVTRALRAMLQPNSPVRVRLQWNWALWTWLLGFARRCNTQDMLAAGRAMHPLLNSSREEYLQLLNAGVIDGDAESRGLLFTFQNARPFHAYAETDRLLREKFCSPAVRYVGDELTDFEPALCDGLAGGWHYPHDLHLDPEKLMRSWHASLKTQGVRFVPDCLIDRIMGAGDCAREVGGSTRVFSADAFVFATGAMTPLLAEPLRFRAPIQPGKGYSITFARPDPSPSVPLIFPETHVAVTPLGTRLRLGSTMEFAGYDETLPPARLKLLRTGASAYLKAPIPEGHEQPWYGWRPMTYDGIPIIDRGPAYANVWIAAGHSMLGLSTASATGRLIRDLITGLSPCIDPAPYSLSRFDVRRGAMSRRKNPTAEHGLHSATDRRG